jgi:hypothetical protein
MMAWFGTAENSEKDLQVLKEFVLEGEEVYKTYGYTEDFTAITNLRIIYMDKDIIGGRKGVMSIPYSKIESVFIEKGKFFSLSNKVVIQTKSMNHEIEFLKGDDVLGFYNFVVGQIC